MTDKRFLKFAEAWIGENHDQIDIESEYDKTLTLRENIEQFKIRHFKAGEYDKQLAKTNEEQAQEHYKEQLEGLKEQKDKDIEQEKKSILEYYKEVYDTIQRFKLKSNKINLMMVKGRGGTGKSWHIRKALVKYNIDYKEIQTITEAVLPEMLHKYNDKVLWLKDVVKIFNSPNAIDIVKAATETDTIKDEKGKEGRLICVNKYSHELRRAGVPKEFMFYGQIIFDFNKLSHSRYIEDFNAMKSRGYDITLIFDKKKIAKLMNLICKNKEEIEVTKYLIKHYKHHASFNLRTQAKAFNTYHCSKELKRDWQKELKYELDRSRTEIQEYVYEFIGDTMVKKAELIKWIRQGKQYAQTNQSARRRVNEWIEDGEIYQTSVKYNPFVSLNPIELSELSKNHDIPKGV